MYISSENAGYDREGQQRTSGRFLLLACAGGNLLNGRGERPVYACVRTVVMRQFGAWMMGTARVGGRSLSLSGAYGNDGLPMDLSDLVPGRFFHRLPDWLGHQYWCPRHQGHNGPGSEGGVLRAWAQANERTLAMATDKATLLPVDALTPELRALARAV